MQTPPGEAFPFSADETQAKVKSEADTKEGEARAKQDAEVPANSGRRVTLIEQFVRNRPDSGGAKFLNIMDAIKGLFFNPRTPEGQARLNRNRGLGMAGSLMDIYSAITGNTGRANEVRTGLGLSPTPVPGAAVGTVENRTEAVLADLPADEVARRFADIGRQLENMNMIGRQVRVQAGELLVSIPRGGVEYRFTYQQNGSVQVVQTNRLPGPPPRNETRTLDSIRQWDSRQFARVVGPGPQ